MNKPVAWINGNQICPEIGYEATITTEHPKDLGWIPLYTHPVKELTDEETRSLKEANKNLMELVTMLREEVDKLRKAQEK